MKFIYSFLFLSYSSVVFAFAAKEIREQYEKVFDEKMRARILKIGKAPYRDPVIELFNSPYKVEIGKKNFEGAKFHPKAIRTHNLLKQKNYIFGVNYIKSPSYELGVCTAELILNSHYLDLLQIYWLGFIAFLEDLESKGEKEGEKFGEFVKRFDGHLPTGPDNKEFLRNGTVYLTDGIKLTIDNQSEFLRSLVVIYAVEVFSSHDAKVSTFMRIRAIKLWKKVDPDGKLLISKMLGDYSACSPKDLESNLLPETFEPGMIVDELQPSSYFIENKLVQELFGKFLYYDFDGNEFAKGLKVVLERYPQNVAQIIHSIFRVHLGNLKKYKSIASNMLIRLVDAGEDTLDLIFGEHASYRNKGRITRIVDDISNLDKDVLADLARSQRKDLKNFEEKINLQSKQIEVMEKRLFDMKVALAREKASNMLFQYDERADYEGLFKLFGLNPFLTFESNLKNITAVYRKMSLDLHPDKNLGVSSEGMSRLNAAYAVLKDINTYNTYQRECLRRALVVSLASLGLEFSS